MLVRDRETAFSSVSLGLGPAVEPAHAGAGEGAAAQGTGDEGELRHEGELRREQRALEQEFLASEACHASAQEAPGEPDLEAGRGGALYISADA